MKHANFEPVLENPKIYLFQKTRKSVPFLGCTPVSVQVCDVYKHDNSLFHYSKFSLIDKQYKLLAFFCLCFFEDIYNKNLGSIRKRTFYAWASRASLPGIFSAGSGGKTSAELWDQCCRNSEKDMLIE